MKLGPERAGNGVSAVVASFRDPGLVSACIRSLDEANARLPEPAHVVLARMGDGADVTHLREGRPWLEVVADPEARTIPQLRGLGMLACGDGPIAVTEDHCVVDPDWLVTLGQEARTGRDVVGGGMGNARGGIVNWAAYFSEYGFFASVRPPAEGPVLVTGANVLYGERVAARVASWARDGLWEDVIHGRLAAEGARIGFVPRARVSQNMTYRFGLFCRDRYEHGRDYARVRLREAGVRRTGRLLTAPLLPPLLLARVARAAAGENRQMFALAAPVTLSFLAAWAFGEAVGYATGPAEP